MFVSTSCKFIQEKVFIKEIRQHIFVKRVHRYVLIEYKK